MTTLKERFEKEFESPWGNATENAIFSFFRQELLGLAQTIEREAILETDYERGNAMVGAAKLIRSKADELKS